MVIPKGENYVRFYDSAKKQGVSIKSRYKNISAVRRRNKIYWEARPSLNGKRIFGGYFEFSENGELEAHKAILKLKNIQL